MRGRVPVVEIADDGHRRRIGRPHREVRTALAELATELVAQRAMRAFTEQVDVVFGERAAARHARARFHIPRRRLACFGHPISFRAGATMMSECTPVASGARGRHADTGVIMGCARVVAYGVPTLRILACERPSGHTAPPCRSPASRATMPTPGPMH